MTTVPRIDGSGLELTTRYFTGQERIKGSDFTHMGGRVLNNSTGRFIQADILNFDPTSTISYSRYAYVLNSPYSYTDPTGYALAHAQLAHEQKMAAQASSNPTTTASGAVTPSSSRVGDTVKGFALNAVYASGGGLQAIVEGVMETTKDIVANPGIYANNTAQTIIDFSMYFLDVGLLNFIGLGAGADTRIWGKMTATASSLGYAAQRIKQAAASGDYRAFGSSVIGLGLVLNPRNLIRPNSVGNGYGVAKETNYLYRGVSAKHPALNAAKKGDVVPGNVNGTVTSDMHNAGGHAANSPFTSWTRDPNIAAQHAAKNGNGGVILRVPQGAPPKGSQWGWDWSRDIYGEQEVLMRGVRTGVEVLN